MGAEEGFEEEYGDSEDFAESNEVDELDILDEGLVVNGVWDNETTEAIQELLSVPVTGLITGQPTSLRGATRGADNGWLWTSPSKAFPDDTLLALQFELDVEPTGFMDLQTINALGLLVGLEKKHELDNELVQLIQISINKGTFLAS